MFAQVTFKCKFHSILLFFPFIFLFLLFVNALTIIFLLVPEKRMSSYRYLIYFSEELMAITIIFRFAFSKKNDCCRERCLIRKANQIFEL